MVVATDPESLAGGSAAAPPYLERLTVAQKGRILFVRVKEIDWIRATGNYSELHVRKNTHLVRYQIGELERRLCPRQFLRIHRSIIVNVDRVKEIHPWFRGCHLVVLDSGQQLHMSRYQREKLHVLLGSDR